MYMLIHIKYPPYTEYDKKSKVNKPNNDISVYDIISDLEIFLHFILFKINVI